VARFVIEQMRTDSLYIGPFPAALWISAGLVAAGVGGLAVRHLFQPALPLALEGASPQHRDPER
jgi:hypothetical protein